MTFKEYYTISEEAVPYDNNIEQLINELDNLDYAFDEKSVMSFHKKDIERAIEATKNDFVDLARYVCQKHNIEFFKLYIDMREHHIPHARHHIRSHKTRLRMLDVMFPGAASKYKSMQENPDIAHLYDL